MKNTMLENLVIGGIRTLDAVLTCMDILGGAILDCAKNILDNCNSDTFEENNLQDSDNNELENEWRKSMWYRTDDDINKLLKECHLYYYSIEYDGRKACEEAIIKDRVVNNFKVYY